MVKVSPARSHPVSRCLLIVGLVLLVGCERSIDQKITETTLKEDLSKQGVGSLKQVSCPSTITVGQPFECTGIFESGIGFRIPVQPPQNGTKFVWGVPSIKGMLNMSQVMKLIQSELQVGEGAIDCGINATYRMVTLGSNFECVLTTNKSPVLDEKDSNTVKPETSDVKLSTVTGVGKTAKEPDRKEPDKIEIAIAPSGDVTWQRLVAAKPTANPNASGVVTADTMPNVDTKPSTTAKENASPEKPADPTSDAKNAVDYDS